MEGWGGEGRLARECLQLQQDDPSLRRLGAATGVTNVLEDVKAKEGCRWRAVESVAVRRRTSSTSNTYSTVVGQRQPPVQRTA